MEIEQEDGVEGDGSKIHSQRTSSQDLSEKGEIHESLTCVVVGREVTGSFVFITVCVSE